MEKNPNNPTFWLLIFLLSGFLQLSGQGKLVFERTEFDFGKIKEEAGPVSVVFNYFNVGTDSVKLLFVKSDCGCTTPTWSERAIPTGGRGFITAAFDPGNRPGRFRKAIYVDTDGNPGKQTLYISGEVIPRELGPRDWYPFKEGNLRFESTHLAFGRPFAGTLDTLTIMIYNEGNEIVKLDPAQTSLPVWLEMYIPRRDLSPSTSVKAHFTFRGDKTNEYGLLSEVFFLKTNDKSNPMKRIQASVDVVEDFSSLSREERATAPKLSILGNTHQIMGVIKADTTTSRSVMLSNQGKRDLIVRKISPSCSCVSTKLGSEVVKPGESTELVFTFNSTGRTGMQNKHVTLITNDPEKPIIIFKIEAKIAGTGPQ